MESGWWVLGLVVLVLAGIAVKNSKELIRGALKDLRWLVFILIWIVGIAIVVTSPDY